MSPSAKRPQKTREQRQAQSEKRRDKNRRDREEFLEKEKAVRRLMAGEQPDRLEVVIDGDMLIIGEIATKLTKGEAVLYALKTLARFVRAMFRIAVDCFRHPLSDTKVPY
jgi:hypothetical protein